MKIRFEQSGGFAGLVKRCEVDSATLSPAAKAGLAFLRSPAAGGFESARPTAKRDGIQYTVALEDDDRLHRVELPGGDVPAPVLPLIQELKQKARPT